MLDFILTVGYNSWFIKCVINLVLKKTHTKKQH